MFGPHQVHAITCKNCSKLIPLPSSWPADAARRSFLCPICRHAYVYDGHSVHASITKGPPGKLQNVVSIVVKCWWATGCDGAVRVHAPLAFDEELPEGALKIFAQSTAHEIPCDDGHFLNGPMLRSGPRELAYVDKQWSHKDSTQRREEH